MSCRPILTPARLEQKRIPDTPPLAGDNYQSRDIHPGTHEANWTWTHTPILGSGSLEQGTNRSPNVVYPLLYTLRGRQLHECVLVSTFPMNVPHVHSAYLMYCFFLKHMIIILRRMNQSINRERVVYSPVFIHISKYRTHTSHTCAPGLEVADTGKSRVITG